MRLAAHIGALLALIVCLAAPADAQTPDALLPELTGRVVDAAGILDPATEERLAGLSRAHEEGTNDQVVVATLPTLGGRSIEEVGIDLSRKWALGQAGEDNGVLLLVAPAERQVRIEVGYGLEGELTDAISSLIIQNSILPRFRANDYAGGITRGMEDIVTVLGGDASDFLARVPQRVSEDDTVGAIISTLFIALFLFFMFNGLIRGMRRGGRRGRGRRRRGGIVVVPGGGWSGGGGFGGSGGFGGGGFGGGFGGGGGGFGGGGASGGW